MSEQLKGRQYHHPSERGMGIKIGVKLAFLRMLDKVSGDKLSLFKKIDVATFLYRLLK
jgi:hypothetical protein